MRPGLIGLAIGLALADSSIVTLALPDVLREFDVDIATVAWVLTSFNLTLALVALPAAFVARRAPRAVFVTGTADLRCRLPRSAGLHRPSKSWSARASHRRSAPRCSSRQRSGSSPRRTEAAVEASALWVAAGIFGAALGPAAGRDPHRGARLGVDLPRAGSTRAPSARGSSRAADRDEAERSRPARP